MNNKPRNPSAFPAGLTEGMTLRDYFAASVAPSVWDTLYAEWEKDPEEIFDFNETHLPHVARMSYELADAMLEERERTE
jgi:hypothetical protein